MLNSLGAGMDAEFESNLGDNGESLAQSRIVQSKDAEATFPFSWLISRPNTEPRCPRNWTALSGSDDVHSLTTPSFAAEATSLPSGSNATRQTGPDSSSPKVEWSFFSIFHSAM